MPTSRASTRRAALAAFLLFAAGLLVVSPAEASRTTDARSSLAASSPRELSSLARPMLEPLALPSLELVEPIDPVESSPRFGFGEDLGLLDPERGPGGFVVFAAEAAQYELTYARNNPLKYVAPDGRLFRTAASQTVSEIAGSAAPRVEIIDGVVDSSKLTPEDLSTNEGARLLNDLATSSNVYEYSEGTSIVTNAGPRPLREGLENLDIFGDSRYCYGKGPAALPVSGVADVVVLDPARRYADKASGLLVSRSAIAFHELAEAFSKVDGRNPYLSYPGRPPGAHAVAVEREKILIQQRPGFTLAPAGGDLRVVR